LQKIKKHQEENIKNGRQGSASMEYQPIYGFLVDNHPHKGI
jgi:hypothetical protein